MPSILAVVVLYHPLRSPDEIVANFKKDVDEVMIVDNTENNTGVAAALNVGLRRAIAEGYDWLLTMDQDSVFEPGALQQLTRFAHSCNEDIAIVSPFHFINRPVKTNAIEEVPFTMTSGNLLRVSAAKSAGLFEEKLFIDSVDNEYCLRLRTHGFRIVRINSAILNHQLGRLVDHAFFQTVTHSAERRYFITRNMLYVMKKYFPKFFLFGSKELIKSFLLIVLVERDKANKLRSFVKGCRDFPKISR